MPTSPAQNAHAIETYGGAACADCVMVIANGDDSGIEYVAAWTQRVTDTNATEDGRYTVVVTGDESYFGTSHCDFCGDHLHGDRIDITFIENR